MNVAYIYDETDGRYRLVTIDDAYTLRAGKGGSSGFRCIECGALVYARFHTDGRAWHFAHPPRQPCIGEVATDLHVRVAEIIVKAAFRGQAVACPDGVSLVADRAYAEVMHGSVRPDVTIHLADGHAVARHRMVLVEITYTHGVGPVKQQIMDGMGVPTLEIDVSHLRGRDILDADLERIVLHELDRKRWLVSPWRVDPKPFDMARTMAEVFSAVLAKVKAIFVPPVMHEEWRQQVMAAQLALPLAGGAGSAPLRPPRSTKRKRAGSWKQLHLDLAA